MTNMGEIFGNKPIPGVEYPCKVTYCGNCSMPLEYCEYYAGYEKCKEWLEKNLPDEFQRLMPADSGDGTEEEHKRQKRGGKGVTKTKKKEEVPKSVIVFVAPRGKKKNTIITGLKSYGIDLKKASKLFGSKFACGSSVTGDDEIVIQGDVKDEILNLIKEQWPEIDDDHLIDEGEHKR